MAQATTNSADASSAGARPSDSLDNDTLVGWLRSMQLIREFETRTQQAYQQAKIGGFCHIYSGQEACAVGTIGCTNPDDPVITAYRDHGHALARGMTPRVCMAEMYGKIDGCAKGKGGSMHMFSTDKHFYGGHGIVGANVPLGAGLAFADKYLENGRVTFTYFGDGASNQGQVYETFNMAALWKLPVVFVIENNQYAMGTSQKRSTSTPEIYTRGEAFGIPGEAVDGMDVLAVKEAGQKAVKHCRDGKGPYILEIKTYRYRGHSMSDPAKYRTREEVQKIREEKDAIEHVRDLLLAGEHATEEDLKAIDKEIKGIVNASADFAKDSPEPATEELWTDIVTDVAPQNA
ncbi:MAG: pyruvate dehydrogenase (acetyl-transferring) E1 component subunit alpha [Phycisphaerales bacterium]